MNPHRLIGITVAVSMAMAMAAGTARAAATPTPVAADAVAEPGIAWKQASSDADVDAAFALARAQKKPVFVYWGAKWCPPCNQVKATLFNRQDFIERSRAFVPVYVDGDSPGAQKLGTRFKVRGYPTMVLFNAQGTELTRLPGEVDAEQYTQVLTLGMNAQRPVKSVLASVKAGARDVTANDWKLLAFYSWDTDEQQVVPKDAVPALLKQLAQACPGSEADTAARLTLKAVAAVDEKAPTHADAATRDKLLAVLADPSRSRATMDVLGYRAAHMTRTLSAAGTQERAQLLQAFDTALQRLQADTTLSRADRMMALAGRVDLARIDVPALSQSSSAAAPPVKLPAGLLAEVRTQVARADREISNGYERQAVITAGADLLEQAGLIDESDALLKANLAKSHSPYYLMSGLASNAKARGDKAGALRWYEEAFKKSEGPATRLQWGASYINALVDLSPQDAPRIELAVQQVFAEAAQQPDAFYERSARSLQRVGAKLVGWNQANTHGDVFGRLQSQLNMICGKLPKADPQRANCDAVLKPAKNGAKAA